MKIKTQDLIRSALDWAVAKCEGYTEFDFWHTGAVTTRLPNGLQVNHRYSRDWAQCGQIIEREAICIETLKEGDGWCSTKGCTTHDFLMWDQPYGSDASYGEGPTPLVAAMRCYVASKLCDEVEIPDELLPYI